MKSKMGKQKKIGIVIKNSSPQTVKVAVASFISHPLYGKKARKTKEFLVHDPENQAKVGDRVEIEEGRPYSARKRWELTRIVKKSELTEEERRVIEEISQVIPSKEKEEIETKAPVKEEKP